MSVTHFVYSNCLFVVPLFELQVADKALDDEIEDLQLNANYVSVPQFTNVTVPAYWDPNFSFSDLYSEEASGANDASDFGETSGAETVSVEINPANLIDAPCKKVKLRIEMLLKRWRRFFKPSVSYFV
ncbi:unnamed protein product [Candida parapsilosis]